MPEAMRWAGAAATVALVAGGFLFFASPSEAARIDVPTAGTEPMAASSPLLDSSPVLASSVGGSKSMGFDFGKWSKSGPDPILEEEEEEEIVIIIEDDEDEDEVLVFDDTLDGPSAAALAELHIARHEHAIAVEYAIRATEAEPKSREYQYLLGDAYLLTKQRRAARKAFRRARRLRR